MTTSTTSPETTNEAEFLAAVAGIVVTEFSRWTGLPQMDAFEAFAKHDPSGDLLRVVLGQAQRNREAGMLPMPAMVAAARRAGATLAEGFLRNAIERPKVDAEGVARFEARLAALREEVGE